MYMYLLGREDSSTNSSTNRSAAAAQISRHGQWAPATRFVGECGGQQQGCKHDFHTRLLLLEWDTTVAAVAAVVAISDKNSEQHRWECKGVLGLVVLRRCCRWFQVQPTRFLFFFNNNTTLRRAQILPHPGWGGGRAGRRSMAVESSSEGRGGECLKILSRLQ